MGWEAGDKKCPSVGTGLEPSRCPCRASEVMFPPWLVCLHAVVSIHIDYPLLGGSECWWQIPVATQANGLGLGLRASDALWLHPATGRREMSFLLSAVVIIAGFPAYWGKPGCPGAWGASCGQGFLSACGPTKGQ